MGKNRGNGNMSKNNNSNLGKNKRINGINKITNEKYSTMVNEHSPKSPLVTDCLKAFLVGGIICTIGECIRQTILAQVTQNVDHAGTITSIILIGISAILTIFGLYEKIGRFAGAGSIVPITGFANSVVSPAIEFKQEGYITGTGVKMFEVAGPVIVYGTVASVVYGVICWAVQMM